MIPSFFFVYIICVPNYKINLFNLQHKILLNAKLYLFLDMDDGSYKCEKHNKNIQFVCASNQWHLVPLCNDCIPSHTQNHQKNIKVMLEQFSNACVKISTQKDQAKNLYNQKLDEIKKMLEHSSIPSEIKHIEEYRQHCIQIINCYFDELKSDIENKFKPTIEYQTELLTKLKTNIELDVGDLQKLPQNLDDWVDNAKKIYFKDSFLTYIQEVDELLIEHKQRVNPNKKLDFHPIEQFKAQIEKSLRGLITHIPQKKEKPAQKVKTKVVKQVKKCKECGSELQYLTPYKKHLFCPCCGSKERNYITKKG